jgi:hypothetical protein
MKFHGRAALTALLTISLGATIAAHTANATNEGAADEVVDEMIVYGTPTALVLDVASMRVDVKQHARSIGRSLRNALGDKSSESQVATAASRTRG